AKISSLYVVTNLAEVFGTLQHDNSYNFIFGDEHACPLVLQHSRIELYFDKAFIRDVVFGRRDDVELRRVLIGWSGGVKQTTQPHVLCPMLFDRNKCFDWPLLWHGSPGVFVVNEENVGPLLLTFL